MAATTPLPLAPPGVSPQAAARAYRAVDAGGAAGATAHHFGSMVSQALQGAVHQGHAAEQQAAQAIAGQADLTQVVQAVSRAELTLQTATAIRDRVVQAYQDIMKMPI